jgi:hypothetical protein
MSWFVILGAVKLLMPPHCASCMGSRFGISHGLETEISVSYALSSMVTFVVKCTIASIPAYK